MGYEADLAVMGKAADMQIAAGDLQIAALNERVAVLEARIEELENPPTSTLMGVTVTGPVRKQYTDLHPYVEVSRVYAQGTTDWANEPQHKAFPNGKWACSNSYALSEANLPRLLGSIPEADVAQVHAWADGHELEHPDKNLTPAEVKARTKRTAPIIRSWGLRVAVCMMGYSLRNDGWLDWVDPDDVDVLCWDKYNSGNKKSPPVYQDPVAMVDEMVAASERFGKPFALWETGTNRFGDEASRVAWVAALRAELVEQGAETAVWFDRASTSGSSWDGSLDRASAEEWLLPS